MVRVLLADSLRGANWPGSEKARYRLELGLGLGHSRVLARCASGLDPTFYEGVELICATYLYIQLTLSPSPFFFLFCSFSFKRHQLIMFPLVLVAQVIAQICHILAIQKYSACVRWPVVVVVRSN